MDELNQHECMATMTALFRHMQRNNITPKVEEVRKNVMCFYSRIPIHKVHLLSVSSESSIAKKMMGYLLILFSRA